MAVEEACAGLDAILSQFHSVTATTNITDTTTINDKTTMPWRLRRRVRVWMRSCLLTGPCWCTATDTNVNKHYN